MKQVSLNFEVDVDEAKAKQGMVLVYASDWEFILGLIPEETKELVRKAELIPTFLHLQFEDL